MDISANIFGKIKMNLQVLGVVLFLVAKYQEAPVFADYGTYVLIGAVAAHVGSMGVFFIKRYFPNT
jgi:uncharacterized membrane protein